MDDEQSAQVAVDNWFISQAGYWDALYDSRSVRAIGYQRRQSLALGWVDRLQLPDKARVLEMGCGAGRATVALAERGFSVVATDAVHAMLATARRRVRDQNVNGKVQLAFADGHALPFASGEFQLVVALGVVPWLRAPIVAFTEIARVLQSGGFLIFSADNGLSLPHLSDPRINPYLTPIRRYFRKLLFPTIREHSLPRMHSVRDLDRMLVETGLRRLDSVTCGFGPMTFNGREFLPRWASVRLDERLRQLALSPESPVHLLGNHYLALCSR